MVRVFIFLLVGLFFAFPVVAECSGLSFDSYDIVHEENCDNEKNKEEILEYWCLIVGFVLMCVWIIFNIPGAVAVDVDEVVTVFKQFYLCFF